MIFANSSRDLTNNLSIMKGKSLYEDNLDECFSNQQTSPEKNHLSRLRQKFQK